jgi:hypothetical protein
MRWLWPKGLLKWVLNCQLFIGLASIIAFSIDEQLFPHWDLTHWDLTHLDWERFKNIMQWAYWPLVLKADAYYLFWVWIFGVIMDNPMSLKAMRFSFVPLLGIVFLVLVAEFTIVPDWGDPWFSNLLLALFGGCSFFLCLFYLFARRRPTSKYTALAFSFENSGMMFDLAAITFFCFMLKGLFRNVNGIGDALTVFWFSVIALLLYWPYRGRSKAWSRAVSLLHSANKRSEMIVFVVFDSLGPLTNQTIFERTWHKRIQKDQYTEKASRDIDPISTIKNIHFKDYEVQFLTLSPGMWSALMHSPVSKKDQVLIYVQTSDSRTLAKCAASLIEEQTQWLRIMVTLPNAFIMSCHERELRRRSEKSIRETQWISTLKDVSINGALTDRKVGAFLHYLPEKIEHIIDGLIQVRFVWHRVEEAADQTFDQLKPHLPKPVWQLLEKVQKERNPVDIFYGLCKILELLVHFYAMVAIAAKRATASNWETSQFVSDAEGATLGAWCEIGKDYCEELDPSSSIIAWWNASLSKKVVVCMRELLAGVGVKPSRLRRPTMSDLQDFVVTFRNKTSGHGVLTYEVASEALQSLAVVLGTALSFSAKTGLLIVKEEERIVIQTKSLDVDATSFLREKGTNLYLLSAYHAGSPEFICYQTGEIEIAGEFRVDLDE